MKKVKMILSGSVLLAIVGVAFAFTPAKYSSECLYQNVQGTCTFIKTVKSGTAFSASNSLIIANNGDCADTQETDCTHSVSWATE